MKIRNIDVTVTYRTSLGAYEIPDEIYNEMKEAFETDGTIYDGNMKSLKALDWLSDEVKERDAWDWEIQIDDLEEDDAEGGK